MATLYSKKPDLALYAEKSNASAVTGKIAFQEKVKVLATEGRWVKVGSSNGKSGWVYSGNLSDDKPPDENKNDFNTGNAGDVSTATAARGIDETSKQYASRNHVGNAVELVEWMESFNDKISTTEVVQYMKDHKLGEYAGS
ncbi:MAG: SH3 domain-containing protein [Verrucomicrobiae bacterium]|nr:SH3 domain-containing protein [Verrucomicrobiae bacterium]